MPAVQRFVDRLRRDAALFDPARRRPRARASASVGSTKKSLAICVGRARRPTGATSTNRRPNTPAPASATARSTGRWARGRRRRDNRSSVCGLLARPLPGRAVVLRDDRARSWSPARRRAGGRRAAGYRTIRAARRSPARCPRSRQSTQTRPPAHRRSALTCGRHYFHAKMPPLHPPLPMLTIPFDTFTLGNGLPVILHVDRSSPLVAVDLWYHVGSKDEIAGAHRLRAPVRAPDVHGLAERALPVVRFDHGELGRPQQRHHQQRPHELLRDRARATCWRRSCGWRPIGWPRCPT